MDDLISRQAAIDAVNRYDFKYPKYMERFVTEVRDAIKADIKSDLEDLPSAQQYMTATSNTMVSDTVKIPVMDGTTERLPSAHPEIDEWCTDCKEYDSERHCCPRFNRVIRQALSERKTGRWIHDGYDHPHGVDWMHCSVCGRREPYVPAAMTNYCPSCGAKMEVEHDSD